MCMFVCVFKFPRCYSVFLLNLSSGPTVLALPTNLPPSLPRSPSHSLQRRDDNDRLIDSETNKRTNEKSFLLSLSLPPSFGILPVRATVCRSVSRSFGRLFVHSFALSRSH